MSDAEEGALPYADDEYDETARHEVERLLQEELARMPPQPRVASGAQGDFLRFCRGRALEAELPRLARNEPMQPLGTFAASAAAQPPAGASASDPAAWLRAAETAMTQREHQRVRAENLALLDVYGPNAWLAHIRQLEEVHKLVQAQRDAARAQLTALHAARRAEHVAARRELDALHAEWLAAVAKNAEVLHACEALEAQLLHEREQHHQTHS